jgi:hypothetical protein
LPFTVSSVFCSEAVVNWSPPPELPLSDEELEESLPPQAASASAATSATQAARSGLFAETKGKPSRSYR